MRAAAARLLTAAPILAGLLYLVLFALRLADFTRVLYLNADVSAGPVIARLLPDAPGGRILVLGNYPWAEALWMQQALDGLTGSRAVLVAGAFALWAVAVSLFAVTLHGLLRDPWLTGLGVVVLVAAGPAVWATYAAWTVHGLVLVHLAVVGAFWAWLVAGARGRTGLGVGAAVGVATGVGCAADPLLVPAALLPLAGAALLWRAPGRTVRNAVGVCLATSVGAAVLTRVVMGALGIRAAGALAIGLESPGGLVNNADLTARALLQVFNADVARLPFGGLKLAHLVAGAVALGWAALCGHVVWTAVGSRSQLGARQRAHVLFWGLSALLLLAAVELTTAVIDPTASRYLVAVLFAVAALLPVFVARHPRLRGAVAASVAMYALVGVVSLVRGELTVDNLRVPDSAQSRALARYAAEQDVRVAYAGYGDAIPLTWNAGGLEVYPVKTCEPAGRLCPFDFHRISSWYRPRGPVRSLLVLDRRIRGVAVTTVDPRLGRPAARTRIGQLEVVVFDRDIAAGFGPPATEGR
jgi:hypothetical protein